MINGITENGVNYSFEEYLELSGAGKTIIPFTLASLQIKNIMKEHSFPYPSCISSCPRKLAIEQTRDIYLNLSYLKWSIFGSAMHLFLEKSPIEGTKEAYIKINTGKYTINGCVDFYADNLIKDYKTTKAFWIVNGKVDEKYLRKDSYIIQVNLYGLGLTQRNVPVKYGCLEYYANNVDADIWCHQINFDITPESMEDARVKFNNHIGLAEKGINNLADLPISECKEYFGLCQKYCSCYEICKEEDEKSQQAKIHNTLSGVYNK